MKIFIVFSLKFDSLDSNIYESETSLALNFYQFLQNRILLCSHKTKNNKKIY
jgi:hypothetical protein